MTVLDHIEQIQQKPDHIKRRILVTIIGVVMTGIVIVWLISLKYSLAIQTNKNNEKEHISESPFALIYSGTKQYLKDALAFFHK